MKRKADSTLKGKSLAERFVEHLEGEVQILRGQVDFLTGKIERLELAIMEYKSEPAQAYVARTDRPNIGSVPIDKKPLEKKDFASLRRKWDDLTEAEQEQAVKDGSWEVEQAAT
jgi:hypothetical protein